MALVLLQEIRTTILKLSRIDQIIPWQYINEPTKKFLGILEIKICFISHRMVLNSPWRCLGRKTHWSISNRFNHSLIDGSSSCLNIIHLECSGYYQAWYLLEMLHCAIIEKNSHLVRNEDDLKHFETILSAIAAHQYQKESWFSSNSKFFKL